jgi:hypothetical protein
MADGSLGQDDIDKLLAELDAGSKPPADAAPAAPAAVPAAVPAPAPVAAAAAPAAQPLDQDAIDALVSQATEAITTPAPRPSAANSSSGHLDQGEIDKLLAELNPTTRVKSAASTGNTHLDQNEIDRLLNELEVPAGAGSASEIVAAAPTGTIAASPAPASSSPVPVTAAVAKPTANSTVEGPLSQSDIDKLLAELGAPQSRVGAPKIDPEPAAPAAEAAPKATRKVPPAPEPVASVPRAGSDATQALSADEIDAIIAKQGSDAPPGSDSEAVIAQSDIDALVKQLAQATGAPEAEEVAAAIAGKDADIDRLQAEASPPDSPEFTRDAVDVNSVLGRTASTASLHAQPVMMTSTVATVATVEWRAARWLLAAAVLLLGICSGALIVLTANIAGLSGELRAAREVEHPAADGYADKLRLALAKLEERDESERARGVRWMEELKRLHPDRAADIGLALARYFRGLGAWRRAADEYAASLEAAGGNDDPRVLLEHADCLTRLGDQAGAIRQVYAVLASEARWLAASDTAGRPSPDLERNRQAVADAYLTLGRLLARTREGGSLAAAPAVAPGASHASAPVSAPAAGGHH